MSKELGSIKEEVLKFIKSHPGTIYVNLETLFDELSFEWQGESKICSPECENLIYWMGWSEDAVAVVTELEHEALIKRKPNSLLPYTIDGKMLDLPLAKSERHYKRPRWLPTSLYANKN